MDLVHQPEVLRFHVPLIKKKPTRRRSSARAGSPIPKRHFTS
jgi:hypothetical protein